MTAFGELAVCWVGTIHWNAERADVDENGEGVGDDSACGKDLDEIVPYERPQGEFRTVDKRSNTNAAQYYHGGRECVQFVFEPPSTGQYYTFNFRPREEELHGD